MPAVAILLFGSLARADQSDDSDTDLLIVTLDDETRHVSVGHLSLFLYPWSTLENNARNGDLFVCHLVREARPLFDPDGYLPKLKETFTFRSNYMVEIAHATDLGWYLTRYGDDLNSHLQAKEHYGASGRSSSLVAQSVASPYSLPTSSQSKPNRSPHATYSPVDIAQETVRKYVIHCVSS